MKHTKPKCLRKLKGQDYTQVHSEENGVVSKSYAPRKKSTTDFEDCNVQTIDEVDRIWCSPSP